MIARVPSASRPRAARSVETVITGFEASECGSEARVERVIVVIHGAEVGFRCLRRWERRAVDSVLEVKMRIVGAGALV